MGMQRAKLADIQYVAAAAATLYAHPSTAGLKTLVAGLTLFNGNASAETVKVYLVPDSGGAVGTASGANQFLEVSVPAKDSVFIEFACPFVLTDTNDTIQASTTTASKVTAVVHGDTVT